ncbi:MAG: hypothetical protein ABI867_31585 [Kofleriaceae bacterium]
MGVKRRILTVSAGAVFVTALEGIACGNPVAPRCPGSRCDIPTPPVDAMIPVDAGIDAVPDAPDGSD